MRSMGRAGTIAGLVAIGVAAGAAAPPRPEIAPSAGVYRLPYANGTKVLVFDDDTTHGPVGAVDLVGEPREQRHRIVAAADGIVVAIRDDYSERQSGRAAALCRNNYLWLAHANGEWTLYSHMRRGSSSGEAKLKVGDRVSVGQYLGDEGDVGCAMLPHLHFEVAVPAPEQPIDAQGFITDNDGRKRIRAPRFCGTADERLRKDKIYTAVSCGSATPRR